LTPRYNAKISIEPINSHIAFEGSIEIAAITKPDSFLVPGRFPAAIKIERIILNELTRFKLINFATNHHFFECMPIVSFQNPLFRVASARAVCKKHRLVTWLESKLRSLSSYEMVWVQVEAAGRQISE